MAAVMAISQNNGTGSLAARSFVGGRYDFLLATLPSGDSVDCGDYELQAAETHETQYRRIGLDLTYLSVPAANLRRRFCYFEFQNRCLNAEFHYGTFQVALIEIPQNYTVFDDHKRLCTR